MNFAYGLSDINHATDHLAKQGIHRETNLVTWFMFWLCGLIEHRFFFFWFVKYLIFLFFVLLYLSIRQLYILLEIINEVILLAYGKN